MNEKLATQKGLKNFKDDIVHQFNIIAEDLKSDIRQVAEGVVNVNEKFDRNLNKLRKENEDAHKETLAAIRFSYSE